MKGRVIFKATADGIALDSQLEEAVPLEIMALGVMMQEVGLDLTKQALKALELAPKTPQESPLIVPATRIVTP